MPQSYSDGDDKGSLALRLRVFIFRPQLLSGANEKLGVTDHLHLGTPNHLHLSTGDRKSERFLKLARIEGEAEPREATRCLQRAFCTHAMHRLAASAPSLR